uniref:Uncharacterized protein n=1 Tax=viral metagenome TaxID=1070528 RepID=A0A6C0DBQ9_9ZZZZ
MGKKCIPGLFCIENMTLFLLVVVLILLIYVWYTQLVKPIRNLEDQSKIIVVNTPNTLPLASISTRNNPMNDPYAPPLKNDGIYYPTNSGDIRGIPSKVPINIETRGMNMEYQQVGILTRSHSNNDMILPLMGRRNLAGRDKWQYYTISNTGNLNTKLPISVNGKSCTNEYGCDQVYNGDIVYVEGYKDTFNATIYENNLFRYLPY